jgi:hypothetical protein
MSVKIIRVYEREDEQEAREKEGQHLFQKLSEAEREWEDFLNEPQEQQSYNGWGRRKRC